MLEDLKPWDVSSHLESQFHIFSSRPICSLFQTDRRLVQSDAPGPHAPPSRLRPHAQPWLGQQVVFELVAFLFLARAPLPSLARNPPKANYNTISAVAFLKMTMRPAAGRAPRSAPLFLSLWRCWTSSSPVWPLSPLMAAALTDIISVVATERPKVSKDGFLL